MTLNLLRQSMLKPDTLAWSHFNGPIGYNHATLRPLGCKVIIQKETNAHTSWYLRGKDGWNVGMSLEHYRWQLIVAKYTKEFQVSDTVKFCHYYLTQTTITHADRFLHGINTLLCALIDTHTINCDTQLIAIHRTRGSLQAMGWLVPFDHCVSHTQAKT